MVKRNKTRDIAELLSSLEQKNDNVNLCMNRILLQYNQIEIKVDGIRNTFISLHEIVENLTKLCHQIEATSKVATSISVKVRCFDLARSRASGCQKLVHDLIDLQLCSQGILMAMKVENHEESSDFINRFLSMDQELLKRTAANMQKSESVIDIIQALENLTRDVRLKVFQKFDEAVHCDNMVYVERFFKIFPLIGCREEGLTKFAEFICKKLSIKAGKVLKNTIETTGSSNRLSLEYAENLTVILENLARVVEENHPIINVYYGSGCLYELVVILQSECDNEVQNLIKEFRKNRKVDVFKQDINNTDVKNLGQIRKVLSGSISKSYLKDIDLVLTEMSIMHSRAELYLRFLTRKVRADLESGSIDLSEKSKKLKSLSNLLNESEFNHQMQEILEMYLFFERFFMEENVIMAIHLNSFDIDQLYSSIVDDTFFILKKSIKRSLTTLSINGTCAVINNAVSCLHRHYIKAIKTCLNNGYPSGYIDLAQAYNEFKVSFQHGKIQSSDYERTRNNFLIHLNNADKSVECIETLQRTIKQEVNSTFSLTTKTDQQIMVNCLNEIKTAQDALKACADCGLQQLYSNAIKSCLIPWIHRFQEYNHCLTEDEFAAYEAGETFIQYLIVKIDGLISFYRNTLSSKNFDALISILTTDITMRLEKVIKSCKFNRLGGIILDQEIRSLGSYLASITTWSIRDKFMRLMEIATILNLEKVEEVCDYCNIKKETEIQHWRMGSTDVKALLSLRADFRLEDIKRLQL